MSNAVSASDDTTYTNPAAAIPWRSSPVLGQLNSFDLFLESIDLAGKLLLADRLAGKLLLAYQPGLVNCYWPISLAGNYY